ncbi:HD domain-containing phosphohydrolase [Psychromonas hadalis]|uniref:HD domain-containing phosphohydrolase n=1 Tax=Psychromonas hadalis TaxID=211669 RepID=UPI0003B5D115|nr:HD domain-containing phosphohydrolase [Psychromonas hadalis]
MDWLAEEETQVEVLSTDDYCNILIVDDEVDVHTSTTLTMKHFTFEGKSMRFFSAYSAQEARELLNKGERYSLILLDVVMETENAGLDLARYIRQQLNNRFSRIILRTGQPGIAPEQSVIRDFDIDGYKNKAELRKQDLESSFYTSLRAYRDICQLQKHREILEQVIESIASISQVGDLLNFAGAVLAQIKLVLNITSTKMLVESPEAFAISQMEDRLNMFSTNGSDVKILQHSDMSKLPDHERELFENALKVKKNFHDQNHYVYYHHSERGYDTIFAFEIKHLLEKSEVDMIDLFLRNVLLSYENLLLVNAYEETQELAITLLGGTMESHSKETGEHVVRVGLFASLLAKLHGEDKFFCERIRLAAQLHDVGKVGVPDNVLKKEGPLNTTEWEEMKLHVIKGWEILQGLDNAIIKMASNLVIDHHEKWDGSGYPNGKKEFEISIEGRITAIADVFDALCSKRCYKQAWPLIEAKKEIENCAGSQFDPQLSQLFEDNFQLFADIYNQHPD